MKHYNKDALRGYAVTDKEWQAEFAELNVHIPDNLLNTEKGPEWLMSHYRDTNKIGYVKEGMSEKEANNRADNNHKVAMKGYKDLLKSSLKKK